MELIEVVSRWTTITFSYYEFGLLKFIIHNKTDMDDETFQRCADDAQELVDAAARGYPV